MSSENQNNYNVPVSLESHFKDLQSQDETSIKELYSLYELLKKRLEERMVASRSTFVNYSLHDASHSRSIIRAIERFLGEKRISRLSPTDTFMLLICAYAHDYGMAYSYNKIYEILSSHEFDRFLKLLKKELSFLDQEDAQAVKFLLDYLSEDKTLPLQDIYWSISLVVQLYLRSDHWRGVLDLGKDFKGLFESHLKGRFLEGSEGITDICMCHGKEFHEIFQLSPVADGIINDDFHPRFVAAMLRLGDLLDLDNDRFPTWFVHEAAKNKTMIPKLSILHYRKHESISHLLITEKRIEIQANCDSAQDGYETASLVSQWTGWLQEECRQLRLHWNEIAPENFWNPPANPDIKIFVDTKPYRSMNRNLHMRMSQERVMDLLKGTSIYRDEYIGIREVIQNAIDASLLQMWEDITHNSYLRYKLSKDNANAGLKLTDFATEGRNAIFSNYDITVEVIKDLEIKRVLLVVKDKGIGISLEDIRYIADIGSSKENNPRLRKIMEKMPAWMKPSGIFGIGLQSVFQLCDCIEFYTRQPNQPERLIALYSYGKNKGKIDVHDVPPNEDGVYFDNTVPGTSVKITINPYKMISPDNPEHNKHFLYYDTEFDLGNEIDIMYAEICKVCKERIKSVKCDYFNIIYREITHDENQKNRKDNHGYLRRSFFDPYGGTASKKLSTPINPSETLKPLLDQKEETCYCFTDNSAYYWDEETCRRYYLKVRPCEIRLKDKIQQVYFPNTEQNLYHVSYKFNTISDTETIYHPKNRSGDLHAGFLDWNILILDDNPARYMNIDREHLRENAISEEELLQIRKPILEKWCDYFCELDEKNKGKNRFRTTPGILLSLTILFFQNVPINLFEKFISTYQDYLEKMNLFVGTEQIPIPYFWNPECKFQTEQDLPRKFVAFESDISEVEALKIRTETLRHFPKRLLRIDSIRNSRNGKLIYDFHFESEKDDLTIVMNDVARLFDYMQVFDSYRNQPQRINVTSIQKKVFKPDAKYPHLVLPCYPHTFSLGRNFSFFMDNCMSGYILSPFSIDTANILKRGIEKEESVKPELLSAVKDSDQFQKCVQYIFMKRYADRAEQETVKEIIIREYENFIDNLYETLTRNRLLILGQFDAGQ